MMLYDTLARSCKGEVLKNEPLCAHTSFGIGGPADCFVRAEDLQDLEITFEATAAEGCALMIIGNGTNLLVPDEGFGGVVLRLGRGFGALVQEGTTIRVGAGLDLPAVLEYCVGHGLGGLEFAAGIPGTVGGALYTDASTKTGWVRELLSEIRIVGRDRVLRTLDKATYHLEAEAAHAEDCIIEASFALADAPEGDIRREVERYLTRRRATQPIEAPSAGCIFRNPETQPAGKLIDQCGCKGMSVGGATVSERHANFIINTGGARAQDVLELIERVRARVFNETGIRLELEINIVGSSG